MAANINHGESHHGSNVVFKHSSPRLCHGCASFYWPRRPGPGMHRTLWEDVPFGRTFHSLQESADRGCAFCRFLWSLIVSDCLRSKGDLKSLTKVSIKLAVFMRDFVLSLGPSMEDKGESLFWGREAHCDLIESSEMELVKEIKSRQIKAFNELNILKELVELVEQHILPWIERCREGHANHESCGTQYMMSHVPTRLVDVGEMNDLSVKLVEVKKSTHIQSLDYLILSYCWGDGNENSRSTESNLDARLRGFSVLGLPKTIRDAILLTRMMGFRYLWVDAICIIQGPSGDFHSESPRMGAYYSNAACCIAASSAKDSAEGFLTERPLARFPLEDIAIRIPENDALWKRYSIIQAAGNTPYLERNLIDSPLTDRAWCLQETVLPQRILHWTLGGLYLECPSSLLPEDTNVPWQDSSSAMAFTPRDVMTMPDGDILFEEGWYWLVSHYSYSQLTYETDRLYAIHGLASILIRRLRVEYFNGLFRPSLAQGLLWVGRGEGKRPKNAQLSSWSWASSCPVDYYSIRRSPVFVTDDHPGRPLHFPTHSETLDVVESTDSRLYIRAPVIHLLTGKSNIAYMINDGLGHKERFKCRYRLDENREVMLHMPEIPSPGEEWGKAVDVLWLPVGREVDDYSCVWGLLVHEVPKEGKGVYCRYGILAYEHMPDSEHLRDVKNVILI